MKPVLAFVIAVLLASPIAAQTAVQPVAQDPAAPVDLSTFLWKKRVLVVFSDSPGDPRFTEQMALVEARIDDLIERDVIVLIDTDPATLSPLREKFRPRGFMLVLIGKDGNVYLRKPRPWDVREISRSIDKMPIRREEMRND